MQQQPANYRRIATAISYINDNFKRQPSLAEIAAAVNLSPFHFQRLFSEWAGVSPKKFIQFLSVEYAKGLLQNNQSTVLDAAYNTGLSGSGRLHDLFVQIEGMTPGDFKSGGAQLAINYSFAPSPFGIVLVASTSKGVCHMAFADDEAAALAHLQQSLPKATFQAASDDLQQSALTIFNRDWQAIDRVKLHLSGTPFQLKVWQSLLSIPSGKLQSYGQVASHIGQAKASRAVGSAIGSNPVAFLIPCHRVIQQSGKLGGYMWGSQRKSAIIAWEAAQLDVANQVGASTGT